MSFSKMIKQPSAFLPVIMSFVTLALVLGHIIMFGIAREAGCSLSMPVFSHWCAR
jgi:hypothetical protein